MAVRRLEVQIVGNAKGAQKALGDLEKASGRAGKKTEGSLSKANKALIGFGAGAAIYGAFSAFDEAQKVTAQTEAVLKSTGSAANVTSKEIEDLAGSLSKKSGVDDEAIQSGENLIATFTNIRNEAGKGNDVFTQTTKAALDMSVAMGTDMKSASMMLGKALNDPVAGLAKLTKVGVTFTAQQKDQIRALADSGDRLGAQKVILQEINKEFGGSAEAQATALGKAKVSVDNMAESVGGALAPALETAASALGFLADGFSSLPSGVQTGVIGLGLATAAVVKWHDAIGTGLSAMKTGVSTIGGFASALGSIDTLAAERGLSRVDTLLNVLDAGGNKKSASVVKGIDSVIGAMGGFPMAGAAGAAGIGLLVAGYVEMTSESKKAEQGAQDLLDIAEQTGVSLSKAFDVQLANTIAGVDGGFGNLGDSAERFGQTLSEAGISAEELSRAVHGSDAVYKSFMDNLKKTDLSSFSLLAGDIDTMRRSAEQADSKSEKLATTQESLGVAAETAAGKEDGLADRTGLAARTSEQAAESHKRNADALAAIKDQAQAATTAIKEFYDEQTNNVSTQIDAERALDGVAQSLKDNGLTLDISGEKGRLNREAIIGAKDAQLEYAMALRDTSGTGAAISSMVDYSGKLAETLRQSGLTEAQTQALIAEMGLTPKDIYTTFRSNSTEAELKSAAVRKSIEAVPGWKDIYFNALTDTAQAKINELSSMLTPLGSSVLSGLAGAAIQQSSAAHTPGRAKGGPVRRGSIYEVNEEGRELFAPGMNGSIIPAGLSRQIMAGGGGTVTNVFHITETKDAEATARAVARVFERQSRMGGTPLAGVR